MELATLMEYSKHKDGTYVAMEMTEGSRAMLDHFVDMSLGLEERVDPSTYHITIIYSRTPVPDAERLDRNIDVQARCVGYEIFPTKNDGKCLVMRMACPKATKMNAELSRLGATSDYGEYKAHVTLAYDIKQEIEPMELPLPQFTMNFDKLTVDPLDPQFTPENK